MKNQPLPPAVALKNAVSSLRLVGGVFLVTGMGLSWFAAAGRGRSNEFAEIIGSISIFQFAPGVLYQLAAVFIRRHDVPMALLARRTAILQSIAGVLGVAVFAMSTYKPMLIGAIPVIFFVPALLAQVWEIGKALEALRMIPEVQRGFEVETLAVIPIEEESGVENDAK